MSEENPNPTPPTTKTSAVPLKKETVRITLRARPAGNLPTPRDATAPVIPVSKKATAQIQLPSAPLPPPAVRPGTTPVSLPPVAKTPVVPRPPTAGGAPVVPRPPTAPGAPKPPVAGGAPVAPRPPSAPGAPVAPRPPGAPAAPGARIETGAATSPLAPRPAPRPVGAAGAAPAAAGAATGALPSATVKMQPSPGAAGAGMARPKVATPSAAPIKRAPSVDNDHLYEEKDPEAGLVPLSVVCLVLGVVLLVIQILGTDSLITTPANQPSGIMVPETSRVDWESQDAAGVWRNSFDRILPQLPE